MVDNERKLAAKNLSLRSDKVDFGWFHGFWFEFMDLLLGNKKNLGLEGLEPAPKDFLYY